MALRARILLTVVIGDSTLPSIEPRRAGVMSRVLPWSLTLEDAYRAYRNAVIALRDHALVRVTYVTGGGDDEPDWTWASTDFDVLDQGVEVETATGARFAIPWDHTFAGYGLTVLAGAFAQLLAADANVGNWDVSTSARWQPVLHTPIDDIRIDWLWSWERKNGAHVKVPYTFELDFRSGMRTFLVAAAYFSDRDDLFPMTEDVVVISDEAIAERYGIGPYGSAEPLE